MNKQHRLWLAIALIFVLTLACITPGFSPQSPIGTLDPNSLSTAIAGTANAASTQTAQAVPPTNTQPPEPTQTPTPTETVTPTPRISTEGTSLSKQSDGTYNFIDYQGGYSIVVPAGWLAIRPNEEEYINAWMLPEASDLNIQRLLTQWQKDDPKVYRLYGLDTSPEHLQAGIPTDFSVTWTRDNPSTIEQYLSDAKKLLPQTFLEAKITYAGMGTTSSQIPMGTVEASSKLTLISGEVLSLYQKQAVFHGKTGLLVFTFTTVSSLKDTTAPSFDSMVDGIKMLP